MSILTDDLAAIYTDTSATVAVVYGAQNCRGFLSTKDLPEPDDQGGVIVVERRSVKIVATALTGLTKDTSITVDGVAYKIHSIRQAGRGRLRIILA